MDDSLRRAETARPAELARELAAQLQALATPPPAGSFAGVPPAAGGPSPRGSGSGRDLSGPRTILENAARFTSPHLPSDSRFRAAKALLLRALRIVTRDQTVFNSALFEALRSGFVEIEAGLNELAESCAASRGELEERVDSRAREAQTLADERDAALGKRVGSGEELLSALAGRLDGEAGWIARTEKKERELSEALEGLGTDLHETQMRTDIVEVRGDDARERLELAERLLAGEQAEARRLSEELRAVRLEWTALRADLRERVSSALPAGLAPPVAAPEEILSAGLYADFERSFRGSEEEIRRRQKADAALFVGAPGSVADLGCGRGEFLELLKEAGVDAVGCDSNPVMTARAREKGLSVEEADLFSWLKGRPRDSLGGITAFQVVEHLPSSQLATLVELAVSRLAPAGRLLFETVNPESVYAMKWFWMDLTHVRPVPAPSLAHLFSACGLRDVRVEFRSPVPEEETGGLLASSDPSLAAAGRLLFAPQDFIVTGVK